MKEHLEAIEKASEAYHAVVHTATRPVVEKAARAVKEARAKLAEHIIEGAKPCADCKSMPHGILQQVALKSRVYPMFEIGCLNCPDHRAQGLTRANAVYDWNNGSFLPPKPKE